MVCYKLIVCSVCSRIVWYDIIYIYNMVWCGVVWYGVVWSMVLWYGMEGRRGRRKEGRRKGGGRERRRKGEREESLVSRICDPDGIPGGVSCPPEVCHFRTYNFNKKKLA